MSAITIGTKVKWTSCGTTKKGTVVWVVGHKKSPPKRLYQTTASRSGESYIVAVARPDRKDGTVRPPEHYWPHVSQLEVIR